MSETKRTLAWENVELDSSRMEEDETTLTFRDVVMAREGVQPYRDGRAYKSAEELEKYAPYARGWAVAGGHPKGAIPILTDVKDIAGETINPRFVKDLLDPKTARKNIRGVRADLVVYKNKITKEMADDLRSGRKNDVSIGFLFERDMVPGKWNGQSYDYTQRTMFHNHLAFGIKRGRCTMPFCGIGADQITGPVEDQYTFTVTKDQLDMLKSILVAIDPIGPYENWDECIKDQLSKGKSQESAEKICGFLEAQTDVEETEEHIRIPVTECEVTATITLSEEEGIKALYCGKVEKIKTYLFEKDKGWTVEKAQTWVKTHKDESEKEELGKMREKDKKGCKDQVEPKIELAWKDRFPEAFAALPEEIQALVSGTPEGSVEPVTPVEEPAVQPIEEEPAPTPEPTPDPQREIERTDKILKDPDFELI